MSHMFEIVLFRLNEGATESEFLDAAQATFDLLESYEGYVGRTLSVSDDGLWTDVVTWTDIDTALKAAEHIMSDPVGQRFGSLINPDTIQMTHVHPKLTD